MPTPAYLGNIPAEEQHEVEEVADEAAGTSIPGTVPASAVEPDYAVGVVLRLEQVGQQPDWEDGSAVEAEAVAPVAVAAAPVAEAVEDIDRAADSDTFR